MIFEFDPVPIMVARLAIALLFLSALWVKLKQPAAFRATLADYELLPARLLGSVALVIIGAEIAVAVGSFVAPLAPIAMLAAAALLTIYALAIAANLLRGRRDIDCGCTGPALRQMLSGWLLLRNGMLVAVAFVGAQQPDGRVLGAADFILIAASLAVASLLYAAMNQLMSNTPRLDALDELMETT